MKTFDDILPLLSEMFSQHVKELALGRNIVINRDLYGRVRIIVDESVAADHKILEAMKPLMLDMQERLGPHAYPAEQALLVDKVEAVCADVPSYPLEGFEDVRVIDRLASESNWASIEPETVGPPRVVFFSIKGGVGRSTALAASALALAQAGKRVLVLDLDLESPGLSTSLLPASRLPTYGIADWLVEDLVGNGSAVFEEMVATSTLAHDGEIYVVPAHGRSPGEYIAKLGRAWMPIQGRGGAQETWSKRLSRLIDALAARWLPDVILIDSRAGIDDIAASCLTDLGATLVLLFALEGEQTWTGYRILFEHWRKCGVAEAIRERLQLVGAMIPEMDAVDYFAGLREHSHDLFTEELYDEVPPGEVTGPRWNFDESDESAPHYPIPVRWHRSFAALRSLHTRLESIEDHDLDTIFGPLIATLMNLTNGQGEGNV